MHRLLAPQDTSWFKIIEDIWQTVSDGSRSKVREDNVPDSLRAFLV